MFDKTNRKSFENIQYYADIVQSSTVMLIGNKSDMVQEICVTSEEAKKAADELNWVYLECSVKFNFGVKETFNYLFPGKAY